MKIKTKIFKRNLQETKQKVLISIKRNTLQSLSQISDIINTQTYQSLYSIIGKIDISINNNNIDDDLKTLKRIEEFCIDTLDYFEGNVTFIGGAHA